MRTHSRLSNAAPPALFFLGVLCLGAMGFVAAWPDMEASTFDPSTALMADERLEGLRCPRVIGADETGAVRARFRNATDRPTSFLVRARISRGFVTVVRQDSRQVILQPGEARELSWPVTAADAVYDRVVMARVFTTRAAGRPARESACGVLVAGVRGVPGAWQFAGGVLVAIVLTSAGAVWWWARRRPLREHDLGTVRRAGFLAALVVASLVAGLLGWWLGSHVLTIASVLFTLVLVENHFLQKT